MLEQLDEQDAVARAELDRHNVFGESHGPAELLLVHLPPVQPDADKVVGADQQLARLIGGRDEVRRKVADDFRRASCVLIAPRLEVEVERRPTTALS